MSTWPTRSPFGKYTAHERTCPEDIKARDITAICFHAASQNLIVASKNSTSNDPEIPVLQFFKPDIRDTTSFADDVTWQLGPDTFPSKSPVEGGGVLRLSCVHIILMVYFLFFSN